MVHKITINPFDRIEAKPATKEEFSILNKNLKEQIEIDNVEQLSELIVNEKFLWCPSIFTNNKRKNENWLNQSIFVLDFDSGITPEDVLKRFRMNNLEPNLIHSTLSDTLELRKFRVVLMLSELIEDKYDAKFISKNLLLMFPEADSSCKDYARMFFPGKEVIYKNEVVITKFDLLQILDLYSISNSNFRTRNCYNQINEKAVHKMYVYNNSNIYKSTFNVQENEDSYKLIRNFDFKKISKKVKILNDFLEGKWLYHKELFGLATNFKYIQNGLTVFKEIMIKYNNKGKTFYTPNNFAILTYIQGKPYIPQNLENFSPYEEDHQYKNILEIDNWVLGKIKSIKNTITPNITLMEAQEKFNREFNNWFNSDDTNVYLFKVATGLGKTELLTKINKDCIIAFPTHKLKDEVYARMNYNINVRKTEQFPIFENEELNKKLNIYNKIGLYKHAYKLLNIVIKSKSEYSINDINKANSFKSNLQSFKESKYGIILTTHAKVLMNETNHNTIIFDEDPLSNLINLDSMNLNDILNFEKDDKQIIDLFIKYLQNIALHNTITEVPLFYIQNLTKFIENSNNDSKYKFLKFLKSEFFYIDKNNPSIIHFCINNIDILKNKKTIIMSATAPIPIYKKLFKDRLKVIEIDNIEKVGEIIQYTKYSCSREGLKQYAKKINEQIKGLPVITFQEFKNEFDNPVQNMHFGNCSGYDELKGKDIAVVGTDHKPNFLYLFYAKILGVKLNCLDLVDDMAFRLIEWKNFKFKFNTFSNKELSDIQLSLIESEILQAIGRNRTLRNNCTTHLYSNLPLEQSDKFIY